MMTMMAGAVISPSLPQIKRVFIETENIALLSRLVITLPAIFIAVFSPLFGNLIDQFGRKKLLLLSLILYAVGGTSGFFLFNIYSILAGRAILGIGVAGIMTIATTLIGDYFTGNERNRFAGLQGAFIGLGGVLFISVAGLFADIHWQMPFLIYLFAIPVFILTIFYIYEPKLSSSYKKIKIKTVKYNRSLSWLILLLTFTGIIFFYMIPVQIPFIIGGFENTNNAQIGYAISLSTLSSALVSANYFRIKKIFSFRQIFQLSLVFMGIGFFIVSMAHSFSFILLAMSVSGIGTGLLMPTGSLWMLAVSPEQIRGTLVGRISTASYLGMFFSPVFFQPIINGYTVSTAFLTASVSMGIIAVVLFGVRTKM